MEGTGVYWKPVFSILEGEFDVVLVNAHHIKTVPGRKTDVLDCQWIAQLLQHGLLRASFIPPRPIRELRDLTRQRRTLVGERSSAVKRIHKVLEDCNIKLSSVATDVMGASGRDMIEALIDGEQDPLKLAALARGRLKAKRESLRQALYGHVTAHHRFMLRVHWAHIESLDRLIADVDQQIEEQVRPFSEIVSLLDRFPASVRPPPSRSSPRSALKVHASPPQSARPPATREPGCPIVSTVLSRRPQRLDRLRPDPKVLANR